MGGNSVHERCAEFDGWMGVVFRCVLGLCLFVCLIDCLIVASSLFSCYLVCFSNGLFVTYSEFA